MTQLERLALITELHAALLESGIDQEGPVPVVYAPNATAEILEDCLTALPDAYVDTVAPGTWYVYATIDDGEGEHDLECYVCQTRKSRVDRDRGGVYQPTAANDPE